MPRCQARNRMRRRRTSRSALVRVDPLMVRLRSKEDVAVAVASRQVGGYITTSAQPCHAHADVRCAPRFSTLCSPPAAALPGVGPKIAPLLDRLLGEPGKPARVLDLLFHLPTGGICARAQGLDRRRADRRAGDAFRHRRGAPARPAGPQPRALQGARRGRDRRRHPGLLQRPARCGWRSCFRSGQRRFVSGKIELWDGRRQMVHPDRVLDERGMAGLPAVEAVYGLTEGLSSRMVGTLRRRGARASARAARMAGRALARPQRLSAFGDALHALHRPSEAADAVAGGRSRRSPLRRRLAYDELLASQLALALVRSRMRRLPGRVNAGDGASWRAIRAPLPFALDGFAGPRGRGYPPRPRRRQAHAAPAPGRCGLGQDRGRPPRHGERHRGRAPGRADGADRDPRPPALRAHRARSPREAGLEVALLTGRERGAERREALGRASPTAASRSRSAPTRCSRRASPSATSASRSSTSSTASACTSASRSAPRARRSTSWS